MLDYVARYKFIYVCMCVCMYVYYQHSLSFFHGQNGLLIKVDCKYRLSDKTHCVYAVLFGLNKDSFITS